jgi:hypothetical protein
VIFALLIAGGFAALPWRLRRVSDLRGALR